MPHYEYQCKKCKHRFEKIQKFSDKMVKKCPECGGPVEQMVSAPAVQFKGTGWYVTDYPKKGSSAPASGTSSSDGDSGSKDTAAKDTAKDTAKEAKKEEKPKAESSHKKQKRD